MNVFKIRKIKRLTLESILFSMDEIKKNLQVSASEETVEINAEAMKHLAKAFEIVKKS